MVCLASFLREGKASLKYSATSPLLRLYLLPVAELHWIPHALLSPVLVVLLFVPNPAGLPALAVLEGWREVYSSI